MTALSPSRNAVGSASSAWSPRVIDGGKSATTQTTSQVRNAESEAARLVDTYSDLILRLSYTYLHSTHDAEDLCQTVLLKLLTKAPTFADAEHERAWVVRATVNACKDQLRSGARTRTAPLEEAANMTGQAVETPDDMGVLEAVAALPEAQREAVFLHYFEGYSIAEVSSLTGSSIAAVTKQLSRARATLRTVLKGARHD